ncbi:hypothetical protein [Rhodoblastus sp.]|uniref:hypothetical protein n=1 Tax=Rhodoblastus sp. TaxID=1962975 RepID=UPI002607CAE9|nr:hypothetical protein [Rhodoblastus sp.]
MQFHVHVVAGNACRGEVNEIDPRLGCDPASVKARSIDKPTGIAQARREGAPPNGLSTGISEDRYRTAAIQRDEAGDEKAPVSIYNSIFQLFMSSARFRYDRFHNFFDHASKRQGPCEEPPPGAATFMS